MLKELVFIWLNGFMLLCAKATRIICDLKIEINNLKI